MLDLRSIIYDLPYIKWEEDDDDEFVVRVFGDFVCPQLKEATNP